MIGAFYPPTLTLCYSKYTCSLISSIFFQSPSYLILTVLPSSLPPSILLSTEFCEHFLWAGHCTKCRGCKVDRDVDPSPCSLLSTTCLSAHSSPAHLPFCKSPTGSSKPSTFTFPLHPKLPTWLPLSAGILQNIAHGCPVHFSGSLPSPPLWVVKWSLNCKMQWMLSSLPIWPPNHFWH